MTVSEVEPMLIGLYFALPLFCIILGCKFTKISKALCENVANSVFVIKEVDTNQLRF